MGLLTGKVTVITGGNSGIGFSTAKTFASEGARVVIVGRRQQALDAAVKEIGKGSVGILGDVSDIERHGHIANEIHQRLGGIDVYMANAGINTITHSSHVSIQEYDAQFATNSRGVFFGVQKMIPYMRDGGSVILTGSIASEKVLEGHAVYAGSKAALLAFARSWAIEFSSRNIRVNVLSPGPVDTEILGKLGVPADQRESFVQTAARAIPLGRLGRPNEIAEAALFLASDASSFVTGVNLRVDGGMTLL